MKNSLLSAKHKIKKPLSHIKIFQQLVMGLRADCLDHKQLKYLRFFINRIHIQAAHFLHVATKEELSKMESNLTSSFFKPKYEACSKLLQQMVKDIEKDILSNTEIDLTCDIVVGNILEEITIGVEKYDADLVVLGSKQDDKSNHLLEKELLYKTQPHLLLIPDQAKHQLRKILVPIDFSRHARSALRMAIKINKQLRNTAQIVCIHIEDAPENLFKYNKTIEPDLLKILNVSSKEAMGQFLSHFPTEDVANISVTVIRNEGTNSALSIMEFAKEEEIDFIIIGEDRFSAIDLMKMEYLTTQLLNVNDCIPTLII